MSTNRYEQTSVENNSESFPLQQANNNGSVKHEAPTGVVSQALIRQMNMTSQMNLERYPKSKRQKVAQYQKQIQEVFVLFQKDDLLESEDVGTALRALSLSPTEAQVNVMREEFENEYVTYQKFETTVLSVMTSNTFHEELIMLASEDLLLKAFRTLDTEMRGFIETDRFVELMKTMGEPLSEEELSEMLHAAEDPDAHTIRYEDYLLRLL